MTSVGAAALARLAAWPRVEVTAVRDVVEDGFDDFFVGDVMRNNRLRRDRPPDLILSRAFGAQIVKLIPAPVQWH